MAGAAFCEGEPAGTCKVYASTDGIGNVSCLSQRGLRTLRLRRQQRPSVHVGQLGSAGYVSLQRHLLAAGILSRVRGLQDGNFHCETQNPAYGNVHCLRSKDHV